MKNDKLSQLHIDPGQKERPKRSYTLIFLIVAALTAAAIYFAIPRQGDGTRLYQGTETVEAKTAAQQTAATNRPPPAIPRAESGDNVVLTVSGYVIPRERIELSPRFMGMVKWIGVKKGDTVTNDQVVVLLDDSEYRARLRETEGRLASAHANLKKAELQYQRVQALATASIESRQMEDDMRLNVEAASALVREIEGQLQGIQIYLDWCTIRSPINGVVLEKLVDPNELVTPQSFGGTRGPSTALISVADLQDLQVEIDLNEADVAKVQVGQKCTVSPEAYPDKTYHGVVAEKAPEANRQKGTLQVKVQILNPDPYLTPELTAKVDFLASPK